MSLTHLSLNTFRNIEAMALSPCNDVNVILGENGSGKTSLLEAIYFLSSGKSFRTNLQKLMIKHDTSHCLVHAKKQLHNLSIPLGISKHTSGETKLRIQGQASRKVAELAQILPVQVITPESYELFFGGPKERRKFLDLGVFHVEHQFYPVWKTFNQVLKQRNALLKSRPADIKSQLNYWDKEFVRLAEQIKMFREAYIKRFQAHFFDKIGDISPLLKSLEIRFQAGWKGELADVLEKQLERDIKLGYTTKGPHKADFNFFTQGHSVEQVFSRGQLKLLLYALKVMQNSLIDQESDKQSILLIDDLPSELGDDTKEAVSRLLMQCQSQLFITAITPESIAAVIGPMEREVKMFHVEHGSLITK